MTYEYNNAAHDSPFGQNYTFRWNRRNFRLLCLKSPMKIVRFGANDYKLVIVQSIGQSCMHYAYVSLRLRASISTVQVSKTHQRSRRAELSRPNNSSSTSFLCFVLSPSESASNWTEATTGEYLYLYKMSARRPFIHIHQGSPRKGVLFTCCTSK